MTRDLLRHNFAQYRKASFPKKQSPVPLASIGGGGHLARGELLVCATSGVKNEAAYLYKPGTLCANGEKPVPRNFFWPSGVL